MAEYPNRMCSMSERISGSLKAIRENSVNIASLLVSKQSFYTIYAIALLVFLVVLFIRREHIRRNSDIAAVRNRKAGKVAGKRLREASACMKRGENDRFYEEVLKALWGYLSDKLSIPVSDLTRTNAVSALREKEYR